jgi:hypothetical protein
MSYMVLRSYYANSALELQKASPEAILGNLVGRIRVACAASPSMMAFTKSETFSARKERTGVEQRVRQKLQ